MSSPPRKKTRPMELPTHGKTLKFGRHADGSWKVTTVDAPSPSRFSAPLKGTATGLWAQFVGITKKPTKVFADRTRDMSPEDELDDECDTQNIAERPKAVPKRRLQQQTSQPDEEDGDGERREPEPPAPANTFYIIKLSRELTAIDEEIMRTTFVCAGFRPKKFHMELDWLTGECLGFVEVHMRTAKQVDAAMAHEWEGLTLVKELPKVYTRFLNSGPFLRVQPAKEETVDSPGERMDMTKIDEGVWAEAARGLPHVEKGAPECSRPGLNKPLLSHQVQGLQWMLSKESTDQGGILADDMGLGKTLQMISLAVETLLDVPTDSLGTINTTLVVAPASLIYQWADESHLVYHGDNRAQYRNRFAEYDVVIVSYNTLSSEFALCINDKENVDPDSQSKADAACASESAVHAVRWKRVILDEAHLVKNCDTNRTRAVFALQSTLRWGCTGTPVQNKTRELYAFFHFLGLFKNITQWNREIEQCEDGLQKLKKLLAMHVLRRTKQSRDRNDDKIVDLLDRVYHTDEIDLYPREKRIYKKIVRTYKKQARDGDERSTSMLVGVGRMRQACCHPKLLLGDKNLGLTKEQCNIDSAKIDFAAGLLRAIPDGEKAIVVCEFPEALRILAQKFPGTRFALIDGKMKPKEKAAVCREFNRPGSNLDGILLSLRAGGVGLNLTGANHVIHLNCHWNPTVDDQASDRAYRVGQTRQVHVHIIKTKGTIEERIWALQAEKRELAESLLRPAMQLRESREEAFPEDVLTRLFAEEEEGEEEEEEEWEDVSDEGEQSEGEPMDISM